MTNRVELGYILEKEPVEFINVVNTSTRNTYIWEDKRAYMENGGDFNSWIRKSEMVETPNSGFMEVWSEVDTHIPAKIDNIWTEKYKIIQEPTFSMEWHNELGMLRIIWFQKLKSLKETKILGTVSKQIEQMNLEIPIFPVIYD
jgi:hypothetical protein